MLTAKVLLLVLSLSNRLLSSASQTSSWRGRLSIFLINACYHFSLQTKSEKNEKFTGVHCIAKFGWNVQAETAHIHQKHFTMSEPVPRRICVFQFMNLYFMLKMENVICMEDGMMQHWTQTTKLTADEMRWWWWSWGVGCVGYFGLLPANDHESSWFYNNFV